jgi:transcriptional regulator with XRE-family HTH domain
MAKRGSKLLSDQLRQALDECGLSRYQISLQTGIDQSQLSRFVHGTAKLSMDSMDKLGEALNLKLTMDRKPKQGK